MGGREQGGPYGLTVTLLLSLTSAGAWPPVVQSSRGGEVSSREDWEGPFLPFQGSLGSEEPSIQLCPVSSPALGTRQQGLLWLSCSSHGLSGRIPDLGTLGLRPDHCDFPKLEGLYFLRWPLLPLRCRDGLRAQVHSVVPGWWAWPSPWAHNHLLCVLWTLYKCPAAVTGFLLILARKFHPITWGLGDVSMDFGARQFWVSFPDPSLCSIASWADLPHWASVFPTCKMGLPLPFRAWCWWCGPWWWILTAAEGRKRGLPPVAALSLSSALAWVPWRWLKTVR